MADLVEMHCRIRVHMPTGQHVGCLEAESGATPPSHTDWINEANAIALKITGPPPSRSCVIGRSGVIPVIFNAMAFASLIPIQMGR